MDFKMNEINFDGVLVDHEHCSIAFKKFDDFLNTILLIKQHNYNKTYKESSAETALKHELAKTFMKEVSK